MATTKKKASATSEDTAPETTRPAPPAKPRNIAVYEAALEQFTAATAHFAKGQFAEAIPLYEAVERAAAPDEPILADRARSYASICRGKASAQPTGGNDADTLYHRGVVAANAGRLDEAWTLLDQAIGH